MSSDKRIAVRLILEVVGKPKEHLIETLEKLIGDMSKEEGVNLIEKDIKEPMEIKDQEGFFTTFAEVEVEVQEVGAIGKLMFKYMPANVEVMEPETLAVSNNDLSEFFSEVTRRLHGYDEMARVLQMQQAQMQKKINELEGKSPEGEKPATEISQEKAQEESESKA